jgi:SIR2-like domain
MDPNQLHTHCGLLARRIREGKVVPLLGAGANLCDRFGPYAPGHRDLPSGGELADYLKYEYSLSDGMDDLVRVAQYLNGKLGAGPLYDELHETFALDITPNRLHDLLASLPAITAADEDELQLIVTTNYDDALERAFHEVGIPFDVYSYISDGERRGKLRRTTSDGETEVIVRANEYDARAGKARTVILKIHGGIDRQDPDRDSFVITEDDYIDYLTRADPSSLLPPAIVDKLRRSHILFLGYSMRDWNLRAIFHRLWQDRKRGVRSWAIQRGADELDSFLWATRGVDILDVRLCDYVDALEPHLRPGEDHREAA